MLILQASFDMIGFRAFYMVLERRFLKIELWYGGAASPFIPRFSVYICLFDTIFLDVLFVGSFFDIKAIFFCKNLLSR